jgi:hypothetical protein
MRYQDGGGEIVGVACELGDGVGPGERGGDGGCVLANGGIRQPLFGEIETGAVRALDTGGEVLDLGALHPFDNAADVDAGDVFPKDGRRLGGEGEGPLAHPDAARLHHDFDAVTEADEGGVGEEGHEGAELPDAGPTSGQRRPEEPEREGRQAESEAERTGAEGAVVWPHACMGVAEGRVRSPQQSAPGGTLAEGANGGVSTAFGCQTPGQPAGNAGQRNQSARGGRKRAKPSGQLWQVRWYGPMPVRA